MTAPTLEAERAAPELAPCPFCGGKAELRKTPHMWMVECNNAECGSNPDALAVFKHDAIAAWNRRTAAPAPADVALPPLDAEGLPPLPQRTKFYPDRFGYALAYTSEQVRRAQREAVAADRRARESDMLSDEWKGGHSAGFEAAKHLLSSSSAAAQTIDTPEFRTLVEWWAGAAHSSDKHTRTVRAKAEWAKLIAHIDGRTAGAAPEGRKLVPEVPTEAMIVAIERKVDEQLFASGMWARDMQRQDGADIYDAGIAAAPSHSPAEEDK